MGCCREVTAGRWKENAHAASTSYRATDDHLNELTMFSLRLLQLLFDCKHLALLPQELLA